MVKSKKEALYYNQKVYDGTFGDSYDSFYSERAYRDKIFSKNIKGIISSLKKSSNLLDLGCGTGFLSLNFYKFSKSAKIYNVDISEKMLEILKSKLSKEDIKRSEFVRADVLDYLKSSKMKFDLIASKSVEHFFDYIEVIDLACKKLEKGGFLYIAGPLDHNYPFDMIKIIDNSLYLYKKKQTSIFKLILYLLYAPFNFMTPIIRKIRSSFTGKKQKEDDMLLSETYEGVDLSRIKRTVLKNNLKIILLEESPDYKLESIYKLAKSFKIKGYFQLIAKN